MNKKMYIAVTAATAAIASSTATALPWGSIGILAPQLGIAAGIPVLAIAVVGTVAVVGAVALAKKRR